MPENFKTIDFKNDELILINQTKLPLVEEYIVTDIPERIAQAIENLEVRGAPAIGITAAYAITLCFKNFKGDREEHFNNCYKLLAATRPTAVNLFWALDEMKKVFLENKTSPDLYPRLSERAKEIHEEDIRMCDAIANNGLGIFTSEMTVLTHCNTGKLATGGGGTALNVIKKGFDEGKVKFVYVDETRPLLQGSRLTAFELDKYGIPFAIITDSAAGMLMCQGKIDLAITGADRIAVNGDSANKIGTYSVAALCKFHNIPFYIAAPMSTVDSSCPTGNEIKIELRAKEEITSVKGVQITRNDYDVFSPAFDVTPSKLITGIITDKQLYRFPYDFSKPK